jgi:hypothetical protein
VETDLRLYVACMPVQREHPTLRVAIGTPLTPRAGDSRRKAGTHEHRDLRPMASGSRAACVGSGNGSDGPDAGGG